MTNLNTNEFNNVKHQYVALREQERRKIIDLISGMTDAEGKPLFTKVSGKEYNDRFKYCGGCGRSGYLSGGTLKKAYDLQNFKYIELRYKGHYVLISLQAFDIDPKSKNLHVLYDRVGLVFDKGGYFSLGCRYVSDTFERMLVTNLELPLSEADCNALLNIIIKYYESNEEGFGKDQYVMFVCRKSALPSLTENRDEEEYLFGKALTTDGRIVPINTAFEAEKIAESLVCIRSSDGFPYCNFAYVSSKLKEDFISRLAKGKTYFDIMNEIATTLIFVQ